MTPDERSTAINQAAFRIMIIPAISALIAAICGLLAITWEIEQRHRAEQAEASLARADEWYRNTFKIYQGGTQDAPYRIISLDHGKTWYNWPKDDSPITPADPKLVKDRLAEDALANYLQKHGSVDPNTEEGRALLEGVGFTVERKEGAKP